MQVCLLPVHEPPECSRGHAGHYPIPIRMETTKQTGTGRGVRAPVGQSCFGSKNSTPKSLSLWMSAFIGQRWLSKLLVGNSKQNDFVCPGTSAMLLHHAGVAVDDKWTYYSLSPHDFASDDTSRFMKPGWQLGPITRIDFS